MITDLINTAAEAGNFKTLATALRTAELTATLQGAELQSTPSLADKEKLKGVLLFHVVAGHISAHETGRMRDGDKVKTVSGKEFTLGAHGEVITVNGANVTTRDMMARNGVIHAIDRLIMPS